MNLYFVRPEDLLAFWPTLGPLLHGMAEASSGKFQAIDYAQAVMRGEFQLWAAAKDGVIKAAYLGRIVDFPRRRVYEPLAVAGQDMLEDHEDWLKMLDAVELWAKAQGCTLMQPLGSTGFSRYIRSRGYKQTHVLMEKDI